jgi:integrase
MAEKWPRFFAVFDWRMLMASLKFDKKRKRWRVKWRIMSNGVVLESGSRDFDKKHPAQFFKEEIEERAKVLKQSQQRILLKTALTRFGIYIRTKAQSTQKVYIRYLREFIDSLPKSVGFVNQIKTHHIQDHIDSLTEQYSNTSTVNAKLKPIKVFFRFLEDTYNIPSPCKKIKNLPEIKPDVRFLTKAEYLELLKNIEDDCIKQFVIFIANTGLRASEFCNLKWSDLSHDQKSITIIGKGNKQRTIPLNKSCKDILSNLPKNRKYIFMSKSGKHLQRDRLAIYFKKYGFNPHSLRHYFATQLLLHGVPIIKVSLLLGHSSVTITQKTYAHILPEDIADVTSVLV